MLCFLIRVGQQDGFAQGEDTKINYGISDTTPFSFTGERENAKDTLAEFDSTRAPKRLGEFSGVVGHIIIPLIIFTGAIVGLVVWVVLAVK
jgi:hypothetical protein